MPNGLAPKGPLAGKRPREHRGPQAGSHTRRRRRRRAGRIGVADGAEGGRRDAADTVGSRSEASARSERAPRSRKRAAGRLAGLSAIPDGHGQGAGMRGWATQGTVRPRSPTDAGAAAQVRAPGTIEVAVAILRRPDGRVLLAERLPRQVSAGYWELPGGKIDAGELPLAAAARETEEEVGIRVETARPFVRYEHVFPLRRLRLHFYLAERWHGQPHGREGQRVAWVDPASLEVGPVLPSNLRALALLALPAEGRRMTVTDVPRAAVACTPCRSDGARPRLLIVRPGPGSRAMFAHRLHAELRRAAEARTNVWIEEDLDTALRTGASGFLTGRSALQWVSRPAVPLWAVRCRDRSEAARFHSLGADVGVFDLGGWSERDLAGAARLFAVAYVEADARTDPAHAAALARRLGLHGVIVEAATTRTGVEA